MEKHKHLQQIEVHADKLPTSTRNKDDNNDNICSHWISRDSLPVIIILYHIISCHIIIPAHQIKSSDYFYHHAEAGVYEALLKLERFSLQFLGYFLLSSENIFLPLPHYLFGNTLSSNFRLSENVSMSLHNL